MAATPFHLSLSAVAGRSRELRDRLVGWADINSGSTHFAGLERMREKLHAEFARLPAVTIETVKLEGSPARALCVRCRPQSSRQILLSGHYDTVYEEKHPFQSCDLSDPSKLRGPGVADMKGGLMVMLAALESFEQTPGHENLGWKPCSRPTRKSAHAAAAL